MDEWTLNDLLECSVCLERLDTSSKVLPCQHTFCKKCLEEILSTHRELRCPECRILVGIRIDDLPPNVLLMRILEGMRNSGSRNGTSQDVEHRNKRAPISNASSVVNLPRENLVSNPPSVQQSACVTASPANSQFQLEFRLPTKPRTPSYARAVYDYLSNEPGDLSFKKGDIILLRRKIDNNWYHGESCGQVGAFPLSYVQILARLPCHIPQCKALYDFRMASDDEEGCLTFNKGDIITVYRRVDENWAEGELIDQIGIFPLAFVELNTMARALIKLSSNTEPGASKVAPPTPSTEDATPLIMANNAPAPRPIPKRSVTNVVCSVPVSATDTSSSSLTSPSSSSTTPTTSSSSTPSSPASPPHITPPPPPPNKRHSFGTVHQSNSQSKNNRHSAEILSSPNSCSQPQSLPLDLLSDHQVTPLQRQNSQRHRRSASSEVAPLPGSQNHHMSLQLPASYVALYPYKPQKADELELKRGAVYTVTERCQDGWFKGTSAKSQKSGVFPGNYVAPAKSLPALQAQVRGLYRNSGNAGTARCSAPPLEPRSPISYTRPSPRHQAMPSGENSQHRNSSNQPNEHQSTAVVAPPNVSVQAVCPLTKNCDKNRDKKDKGVSLMRRLTSMKKSKSPPPSSYSMDNPVFEDSSSAPSQAVHVRSGSCPNQLISTSPAELAATHTHRLFSPGSHRAKHKDRPHISLRTSTDVGGGSGSNESIQHRKSHSMDTTSVAATDDSSVSVSGQSKTSQLAPPIRERFRCIVPYPPNSEYELELQLGDVIYVHKKRDDGWYKGTQPRTGRTGLFPASFVQSF